MSAYAPSPSAYRQSAVLTASNGQLVVMLYDGALRFLHQASVAMGDRQVALAHTKLTRAEDILRHLRNTVDREQGELADRLIGLYTFCLRHLGQSRFDQNPAMIEDVAGMLRELRGAWATIVAEPEGHAA